MFCYQCEQTAKGEGCTKIGVCGKQPETADLQDLLMYTVKGLSQVAVAAKKLCVTTLCRARQGNIGTPFGLIGIQRAFLLAYG